MPKIASIIEQFDVSINEIDKLNLDQLNSSNQKIKTTQKFLVLLRKEVIKNGFSSTQEEIDFFKNQKPYIKGRLKFYLALNDYYLNKPTGEKSKIRKYINIKLSKISNENCKYNGFRNYIKLEKIYKDNLYFLRTPNQLELLIEGTPFNNPNIFENPDFCTSRDHLVAKIVKNDLLTQFYTNELEINKKKNAKPLIQEVQPNIPHNVTWTGSNIALFELFLSLKENKSLNHGNITIKELKNFAEFIFSKKMGNFYKYYQEIKSRKINNTKFLDNLKNSMQNKIDLDDNI